MVKKKKGKKGGRGEGKTYRADADKLQPVTFGVGDEANGHALVSHQTDRDGVGDKVQGALREERFARLFHQRLEFCSVEHSEV